MTLVNKGLWELWKNWSVAFQAVVGAVFSVHNGVRFHRPGRARVTKVTDDIGRIDDESR
jgi:hypothetical protein